MAYRCAYCGAIAEKCAGHVNRARAAGLNLYCDRKCAGLGRRHNKTAAQKKAEKRVYDQEYRRKNRAMLKAKKHAYFKRTYDPAQAAIVRKARMPKHVEYCRRPEYRAWKHEYDQRYTAKKAYGPAAEAYLTLKDLTREIKTRSNDHDIRKANGTLNKRQARLREDKEAQRGRPRFRDRRDRHSATHG